MPCSGDGSTGIRTERWLFENWARTQRVVVPVVYNPQSVRHIVAAVQAVERAQGTLKAIGSGWAYGGAAVDESTQHVIYTAQLDKILNGGDAADSSKVIPYALRADLRVPSEAKHYVHVEAGVKIHKLNEELDKLGLAMPTLGGNYGQSLAGAISTGTHGADVSTPPIADAVAAIHLVGPGGQEWWIERDQGAGAITDRARMADLSGRGILCGDIRIEHDTSMFCAVLVSMGRMGVVYSYVLKAVDAFGLRTTRQIRPWTQVRASLRDPAHEIWTHRWLEIFVTPIPTPAMSTVARSPPRI